MQTEAQPELNKERGRKEKKEQKKEREQEQIENESNNVKEDEEKANERMNVKQKRTKTNTLFVCFCNCDHLTASHNRSSSLAIIIFVIAANKESGSQRGERLSSVGIDTFKDDGEKEEEFCLYETVLHFRRK